ncbi:hypothetical protein MEZE111188_12690 [Mesobacillus zeae]
MDVPLRKFTLLFRYTISYVINNSKPYTRGGWAKAQKKGRSIKGRLKLNNLFAKVFRGGKNIFPVSNKLEPLHKERLLSLST